MKKIILFSVFALCLTVVGCGRIYGPVEQVKAFADEKEDLLSQIGKKLESNPTEAGVDEARKILDGKKDSLKTKREAIKNAPQGFNVDWQSLLMKTEARHDEMLRDIGIKFKVACKGDKCEEKWKAFEKDFNESAKFYQS